MVVLLGGVMRLCRRRCLWASSAVGGCNVSVSLISLLSRCSVRSPGSRKQIAEHDHQLLPVQLPSQEVLLPRVLLPQQKVLPLCVQRYRSEVDLPPVGLPPEIGDQ